jgi:hypothetical protein
MLYRRIYPTRKVTQLLHNNLEELLLDAISIFDPASLQQGCDSSQSGTFPAEAVWQHEVSKAVSQLVPVYSYFCPEVRRYVNGSVGFIIHNWGLELLVLGRKVREHHYRFLGKYRCDEIALHRVVDIRPATSNPQFGAVKDLPNHITVSFTAEFTQATVRMVRPGADTWENTVVLLGQAPEQVVKNRKAANRL